MDRRFAIKTIMRSLGLLVLILAVRCTLGELESELEPELEPEPAPDFKPKAQLDLHHGLDDAHN